MVFAFKKSFDHSVVRQRSFFPVASVQRTFFCVLIGIHVVLCGTPLCTSSKTRK